MQILEITVPEVISRIKIGGNYVVQHIQDKKTVRSRTAPIEHSRGVYCFTGEDGEDYTLLMRNRLKEGNENQLRILDDCNLEEITKDTSLEWLKSNANIPCLKEIHDSWDDTFSFVAEYKDKSRAGLRDPQLGALHAACAHLSVKSTTATIVMPTGTGKTETMISLMLQKKYKRVLVVVPSNPLRDQLSNKFATLGFLPYTEIINKNTCKPKVCAVKKSIRSKDEVEALLDQSNVFVATPNILNSSDQQLVENLCDNCDIVFFDEAHHVSAKTWKSIKSKFVDCDKPVIQFTATPFRNDGKNLEGEIIYNYPLSLAQEKDYFKPIRFYSVEEYDLSSHDMAIAKEAVRVLNDDLEKGLDHLLMARVSSKEKANEICKIYESIAGEHSPRVVHSGMSKLNQKKVIDDMESRNTRICVCVNMMGEGFDFPSLKVAAIHDEHKSLAVFLQFVGRFTRTSNNIGDAAFVANIADPKVEGSLSTLYSQSPDWDKIVRSESEKKIEYEIEHEKLIQGFEQEGDLNKIISLWNLRPKYSTLIFSVKEESAFDPNMVIEFLPDGMDFKSSFNSKEKMYVCVAERNEEVSWGKYKGIRNHDLELLVIKYDVDNEIIFVHSSNYDYFRINALMEKISPGAIPVTGAAVFRVFSKIERPMVRNLGARKTGDISFTMHFGPNVLDVLSAVEKGSSQLSNLAGWGYEDGERCSWGCSQKSGKVWSRGGGNLLDWVQWTARARTKITDNSLDTSTLLSGFLCSRVMVSRRPEVSPISIQWGDYLTSSDEEKILVYFGGKEVSLADIDLVIDDFTESGPILFSAQTENETASFKIDYVADENGFVTSKYIQTSGDKFTIKKNSGALIEMQELANSDPLVVVYANGDITYNHFIIENPNTIGSFEKNNLIVIPWKDDGVNIRVESQGKQKKTDSIQYRMIQECLDDYSIIIDDDGSFEAADIIALKYDEESSTVVVLLIHCKYSGEDKPGGRVTDLYEVCGQAQKSIRWKHDGFAKLSKHVKRRHDKWKQQGYSRLVKGSIQELVMLEKIAKKSKVDLKVWIAQPGVSSDLTTEPMLKLLGVTEDYLLRTSNAKLTVYVSE